MEDYLEELVEGALGLESGTAIAHFAVSPWVSHCLSWISSLLLKIWNLKKIFKVLSIVVTIAPFIKGQGLYL